MPQAIGLVIVEAFIADFAIVGSLTLSTVVGYTVTTALTVGASYALEALDDSGKRAFEQLAVRQPIPTRKRGHGRLKLGGDVVFFDTFGGNHYRAIAHLAGRISYIHEYWLGDAQTALPAGSTGGVVTQPPWNGSILLESRLGTVDQAASSALQIFPYWGPEAQLKGIAYTVAGATPTKHGDLIYPEGAPVPRLVADLVPVYDPRDAAQDPDDDDTWAWSDNAALALLDYLHHESGFGIAFEDIDLDSFRAFADVCDEELPLRVATPEGAVTEKRYRCWGLYGYNEARASVLQRYLDVCDAQLYPDALGRLAVRGGRWDAADFTVTEAMVLGWDEFEAGDEEAATVNQVKFFYTSPRHDYQRIEGDPWDDPDAQAVNGIVSTERDFRYAPSHGQARRLAKIASYRANAAFRFRGLRLRPAGLRAYGRATVRLVMPSLALDATFAVERAVLSGEMLSTVVLDLYAFGPEAYVWSVLEEGTPAPLPNMDQPTPPPVPTGGAITLVRTRSGSTVTQIRGEGSAEPVADTPGLTLNGRYRAVGSTIWIDMIQSGGLPITNALDQDEDYEAQLLWTSATAVGDWSPTVTFTATAA